MPEDCEAAPASGQECNPAPPSTSKLSQPCIEPTAHYDLVIIGAGPAALAVISRILETRPAALYTEDEHRHLHFTHRQRAPLLIPSRLSKTSKVRPTKVTPSEGCACGGRIKILIIDKLGEGFLGLWRRNFRALRISHLRSPMFFHPDASDFDSLIAYANQQGRAERGEGELPDLIEILGVVGKEKSKHRRKQQQQGALEGAKVHVNERDRRDYFTPSSTLFEEFTRQLEHKYRVQSGDGCGESTWPSVSKLFEDAEDGTSTAASSETLVEGSASTDSNPLTTVKGVVKDLVWFDGSDRTVQDDLGNHSPGFLLELADSSAQTAKSTTVISAKAVVSAVGFGGVPTIPSYLTPPVPQPPSCGPGWMHSSCLAWQPLPPPSTSDAHLVVVGGGLTSAQIVVLALTTGYAHVTLLTRGHLKSKPFDVDLGWVGRYSNYLKMQFYQTDDVAERLHMLRAARNGGSVTPTYAKVLSRLQAAGKVEIRTHTSIARAEFEGKWELGLRTSADGGREDTVQADYLVVATGAKIDFAGLPFLQGLRRTHPVSTVGGLPVLTADLEYRRDVPLFVTGAYAGLQIGPAAGNLGGMRDSADRIANRLLELLALPEKEERKVREASETTAGEAAPANSNKGRPKKEKHFTHFNFDLLSVEA
uniref:L-ornithine N(5)-monooxygenase [NAD(P)H] n=1 Tax=Kalmanozyma brasiliensis (strain GHG001) TaxID=1365824 RepID=V5ERM2_KALBG